MDVNFINNKNKKPKKKLYSFHQKTTKILLKKDLKFIKDKILLLKLN